MPIDDAEASAADTLPAGWRRHARRQHEALVRRVTAVRGRWLKTDLFEELHETRALLPGFSTATWTAIDLSPAVAARAAARVPVGAVVSDVRSLPFPDGTFDGVLSTSTLDHFDDTREIDAALRELARVLRPGGVLVVTLDNPRNPLVRLRNRLPRSVQKRSGLVPNEVGATLDAAALADAVRAAGLDVREVSHLLHAPHIVGTRLARYRWWEQRALPWFDRLGAARVGAVTGHYGVVVAVLPDDQ